MIKIVDFTPDHIEQALRIAKRNYDEERAHVPPLPAVVVWPEFGSLAQNGLGVAAFKEDEMLGFLCAVSPFPNAFGSTSATGIFSPLHGNGAVIQDRAKIYARMYQAAGEKWVRARAASHAVCLYAHDKIVQEQFFLYGFGLRCVDAIRSMQEIAASACANVTFRKLAREEYSRIWPLDIMLGEHMTHSPTFMLRPPPALEEFEADSGAEGLRYFVAEADGNIIAFLKVADEGENFISGMPSVKNLCGALCLPEYRGMGVYPALLNFAMEYLRRNGYRRFGVDFESINPAAYAFWLKYFTAYTHSVVRRIDERIF